jgi:hypothetical protein
MSPMPVNRESHTNRLGAAGGEKVILGPLGREFCGGIDRLAIKDQYAIMG